MSHRWSPGGPEWVRVLDYGRTVAWVRPEIDGATIAVYLGGYYEEGVADIWQVRVLRGSDLLDTVRDKPHRIRWAAEPDPDDWRKVVSCDHWQASASHDGHRRLAHRNWLWLNSLPRKVHEAVGYGERR